MSGYLRAAKPLLRYLGTRLISMRSRKGTKRRRLGRTVSNASAIAPAEPDGTRLMNFRFGRPRKTNLKGVLALHKKLSPINTHLSVMEGNTVQQGSGKAAWTLFHLGTPKDIIDLLEKASAVGRKDWGAGLGVTTLPVWGSNGAVPGGVGAIGAIYDQSTSLSMNNPRVDATVLQNQINAIASALTTGNIRLGTDGRLSLYSYDTILELRNQYTNPVVLQVYECVPRDHIMQTAAKASLTEIFTEGWAKKNEIAEGNMTAEKEDSTLYMNPGFCQMYVIERCRTVTLKGGEMLKLHLTHGKGKTINPMYLGEDPTYLGLRNLTRTIVIKQRGALISSITNLDLNVDTGGTSVDWRIATKYRWNAAMTQSEMITQIDHNPGNFPLADQRHVAAGIGVVQNIPASAAPQPMQ